MWTLCRNNTVVTAGREQAHLPYASRHLTGIMKLWLYHWVKSCYCNKTNKTAFSLLFDSRNKGNRVSYLQENAVVGLGAINCCDINVLSGRGEGLDALELMCVNYCESPNSSQILQRTNTVRVWMKKSRAVWFNEHERFVTRTQSYKDHLSEWKLNWKRPL